MTQIIQTKYGKIALQNKDFLNGYFVVTSSKNNIEHKEDHLSQAFNYLSVTPGAQTLWHYVQTQNQNPVRKVIAKKKE